MTDNPVDQVRVRRHDVNEHRLQLRNAKRGIRARVSPGELKRDVVFKARSTATRGADAAQRGVDTAQRVAVDRPVLVGAAAVGILGWLFRKPLSRAVHAIRDRSAKTQITEPSGTDR